MKEKYRLVTRSDMDGLICAVLLKHMDLIDDIKFVHPKDMQDGIIEITSKDIITNLPYNKEAHLVFDHHLSETIRNTELAENHIIDASAPSAAEVVYQYYGGRDTFPKRFDAMMAAANKADSANFTKDEILNPQGWNLLSFIMDARTGLGRFRNFRISNYHLMMDLIDYCKDHDIDDIMKHPDVMERVELYNHYKDDFVDQLKRCSTMHGKCVVLDLTNEEIIYPGNRFMIYALFPEAEISIHKIWGYQKRNMVFAVGKSIINKNSNFNIGELMLEFNGGGHKNAGTCQVPIPEADKVLESILDRISQEETALA